MKGDLIINDILHKLNIENPKEYNAIIRIFYKKERQILNSTKEEIFDLYVDEIEKIKLNYNDNSIICNVYLTIFYYLSSNIPKSIESIAIVLKYLSNTNTEEFRFFKKIEENIKETKINNKELKNKICLITSSSYNKNDLALEDNYKDKIISLLKNDSRNLLTELNYSKNKLIIELSEKKPDIIFLIGHGEPGFGYVVNNYLPSFSTDKYLSTSNLDEILIKYNKDNALQLFDFSCSRGYYESDNYHIDLLYSTNSMHEIGTFNTQSGFFYMLGFFSKYDGILSTEWCHTLGIITMGVYMNDYIRTFRWTRINHH